MLHRDPEQRPTIENVVFSQYLIQYRQKCQNIELSAQYREIQVLR